MNNIPNREAICQVLLEKAEEDRDIVVLCSDSRGSASLAPFAKRFPKQFIEVGIAEQNLVSIAAGLAKCGKKPFVASPACFLSTRSYEQIKIDVAYSNTNVKLIGISGGISYGALGMSHHSAQDIAALSALPNMRIYIPSDRFQTKHLIEALLSDDRPAYIRVGRNPVDDIYSEEDYSFTMDRSTELADGSDIALIACGEMVKPALDAVRLLSENGISATLLDMYCVKPMDRAAVIRAAARCRIAITIEEHSPYGGLGAAVSQIIAENCPRKTINLSLPDSPVITGSSREVFDYYELNAEGICKTAMNSLRESRRTGAAI